MKVQTGSKLRDYIFTRDNYTCHKIPQCDGGDNSEDNLLTACEHCNKSKGKKSYEMVSA